MATQERAWNDDEVQVFAYYLARCYNSEAATGHARRTQQFLARLPSKHDHFALVSKEMPLASFGGAYVKGENSIHWCSIDAHAKRANK